MTIKDIILDDFGDEQEIEATESLAHKVVSDYVTVLMRAGTDLNAILDFCEKKLSELIPKLHDIWSEQANLSQSGLTGTVSDSIKKAIRYNLALQTEWSGRILYLRKMIKKGKKSVPTGLKTIERSNPKVEEALLQEIKSYVLKDSAASGLERGGANPGGKKDSLYVDQSEVVLKNHQKAITQNVNAFKKLSSRMTELEESNKSFYQNVLDCKHSQDKFFITQQRFDEELSAIRGVSKKYTEEHLDRIKDLEEEMAAQRVVVSAFTKQLKVISDRLEETISEVYERTKASNVSKVKTLDKFEDVDKYLDVLRNTMDALETRLKKLENKQQ